MADVTVIKKSRDRSRFAPVTPIEAVDVFIIPEGEDRQDMVYLDPEKYYFIEDPARSEQPTLRPDQIKELLVARQLSVDEIADINNAAGSVPVDLTEIILFGLAGVFGYVAYKKYSKK